MTSQIFIIAIIALTTFFVLLHMANLSRFRKNLWVGQHVDLYRRYEGFLSVIITDIDEDVITVKSLLNTLYDVRRTNLHPKE